MQKDEILSQLSLLLEAMPRQTARELSRGLTARDQRLDKTSVNSLLYSHADLFVSDGAIPPRWTLRQHATRIQRRASHRLAQLQVANWKAFDTAVVPTPGVTLIFGENSSGKSSLLQCLLMLKQSWGFGALQLRGQHGDFGWYEHVVHGHDNELAVEVTVSWGGSSDEEAWSVEVSACPEERWAYGETQPIATLDCWAGADRVMMMAHASVPGSTPGDEHADCWYVVTLGQDPSSLYRTEHLVNSGAAVVLGGDRLGFPDTGDVRGAAVDVKGVRLPRVAEATKTIDRALSGAGEMLASVIHLGPYRIRPGRDLSAHDERERGSYLARLHDDPELLEDVNEWLTKFDIPYALQIDPYGDGAFGLSLSRVQADRDGERVQLVDVGFGISQLLPIITTLVASRERTILIEEPEAHVHPRLQAVLGDLFMTSMQDYGNILVVETHSEPILLRMQRRIAEEQMERAGLSVLHVIRDGPASSIEEVRVLDSGQLDYQWPGGFFDDRLDDLLAIIDPQRGG